MARPSLVVGQGSHAHLLLGASHGLGRPVSAVFLVCCHSRTAVACQVSAWKICLILTEFVPSCFPGDTFSVSHPTGNIHTYLGFGS